MRPQMQHKDLIEQSYSFGSSSNKLKCSLSVSEEKYINLSEHQFTVVRQVGESSMVLLVNKSSSSATYLNKNLLNIVEQ